MATQREATADLRACQRSRRRQLTQGPPPSPPFRRVPPPLPKKRSKNASQGLGAIREARACIELQARLTGKLDERPHITINIMATDEWRDLRERLAVILRPFPEAWRAIGDVEAPEGV